MDTVLRATLDTTLDFFWGLILSEEAFPVLQEFHDSVGDRGLAVTDWKEEDDHYWRTGGRCLKRRKTFTSPIKAGGPFVKVKETGVEKDEVAVRYSDDATGGGAVVVDGTCVMLHAPYHECFNVLERWVLVEKKEEWGLGRGLDVHVLVEVQWTSKAGFTTPKSIIKSTSKSSISKAYQIWLKRVNALLILAKEQQGIKAKR